MRSASRMRLSKAPPHWSVRSLTCLARNWLIRYPSLPITSTPSYPASSASAAALTKSSIVRSMSRSDSGLGVNQPIGAFALDGLTLNGW